MYNSPAILSAVNFSSFLFTACIKRIHYIEIKIGLFTVKDQTLYKSEYINNGTVPIKR